MPSMANGQSSMPCGSFKPITGKLQLKGFLGYVTQECSLCCQPAMVVRKFFEELIEGAGPLS